MTPDTPSEAGQDDPPQGNGTQGRQIAGRSAPPESERAAILTAIVLPGSETPAPDGTTGARRCVLVLPDASRRGAILKRAPLSQVAAEAFSACLLRGWGLPVPDPFIVEELIGPAFASTDAGYPSLKQRFGLLGLPAGPQHDAAALRACHAAVGLPSATAVAAADEAIENRDRNLGNILWDGEAEAWIDHAYALGAAVMDDRNKLCDMAQAAGQTEAFRAGAVGQALALDHALIAAIGQGLPLALGGDALATRVARRIGALTGALLARFPTPDDLLSAR